MEKHMGKHHTQKRMHCVLCFPLSAFSAVYGCQLILLPVLLAPPLYV